MKIAAISDVHIKTPFDDADRLLCEFLNHPDVTSADYVLLLGDVFDLMSGPHREYLNLYKHIFDLMDGLQKAGKKVLFFEGNHDVHLEKLFLMRWPKREVQVFQYPMIEQIEGKSYYFSHGDEHEVDNQKYQDYKALILSKPLRFVANWIMPFALLNFLGERASKMSRKRGSKIYDEDVVRDRFRAGVVATTQGKYDFILGGHSHAPDVYEISKHSVYLNNGYALKTKTFILIDNHQYSFPVLIE